MFPLEEFKTYKTPFYFYDLPLLKHTLDALKKETDKYGYHVHYALKANVDLEVLKVIKTYGLGADCVSGGEVQRAIDVGFASDDIVFAGVGKSDEEIIAALKANIFCFNCESIPEIEVINEFAKEQGVTARIAIRINPNVDAKTHKYITTGLEENKFGINVWELDKVIDCINANKNIKLEGLHFHVGSQITDLEVYKSLCIKVNELQERFRKAHVQLSHINVGGGLGIDYKQPDEHSVPDFESYFGIFDKYLKLNEGQELHFELGRAIVGQCGSLISKVLYVKEGVNTKFVILDAGMTELIRPALYQSYHKIENISSDGSATDKYDVVGPICESSDCFGKAVDMLPTKRGDYVAIRSTGAYGEVMSSAYNLRVQNKPFYYKS